MAEINTVSLSGVVSGDVEIKKTKDMEVARFFIEVEGAGERRSHGKFMVVAFAEERWRRMTAQIDAVVPVPLHKERQDERGYNQSELLAVAFCHTLGLQLAPRWLHRTRPTRQQVGLNAPERQQNVDGAFGAEAAIGEKTLLLIDDVYTTGATLSACAQAAMNAGAKAVFALTLAVPAGPFDPSHG